MVDRQNPVRTREHKQVWRTVFGMPAKKEGMITDFEGVEEMKSY